MTPNRKQHLYTQYVLSVINNGEWYRNFANRLEGRTEWLSRLPSEARKYVKPIARELGEELSTVDRAYIYMMIASYYDHSNTTMRNAMRHDGSFRAVMTTLIEAGQLATSPTPVEQEPAPMNQSNNVNAVAFETKHYVYGMDVTNMSSGQLIDAIKRIEAEIADLKGVKAKSEHLKKRITELEGMLAKVVEVLDAK